jgi:hypothetical protein
MNALREYHLRAELHPYVGLPIARVGEITIRARSEHQARRIALDAFYTQHLTVERLMVREEK